MASHKTVMSQEWFLAQRNASHSSKACCTNLKRHAGVKILFKMFGKKNLHNWLFSVTSVAISNFVIFLYNYLYIITSEKGILMSSRMTKAAKFVCVHLRLLSAWASTQSNQSSQCTLRVARANAQAGLGIRVALKPFCCFCHAVALY